MSRPWNEYGFTVAMPTLAPGHKLSEVEFLKVLNMYQWDAISRMLGRQTFEIVNDTGERLYPSLIDVELHLGSTHTLDRFSEGANVHVQNRIGVFAERFVEGLFLFDDAPIPADVTNAVESREALRALDRPWACMTNAFIARMSGNTALKVFAPVGAAAAEVHTLRSQPAGITEQRRAQSEGVLPVLPGDADARPLPGRRRERIRYPIVIESDLNGAGLLYFARFVAIANYGERMFLGSHLDVPVSTTLVGHLSTDHRRIYYFANAGPTDTIELDVSMGLVPHATPAGGKHRSPFALHSRVDLYRSSDRALMASTVARKTLNVPPDARSVLTEAERLVGRYGSPTP